MLDDLRKSASYGDGLDEEATRTVARDAAGSASPLGVASPPANKEPSAAKTGCAASLARAGPAAHAFLGGLGTYWMFLPIGLFMVKEGFPDYQLSLFFGILTIGRLIATWFAESALSTLLLHAVATAACFVSAASVGSAPMAVYALTALGFLEPVATVTVRLANDNKDAPAAEYDAAVQAAWTGCMVGCLCSVSGSILFTIVGIAGMAVLTGAVAAALTLLHARYWLAHRNVAAAGSRALVVSEVVEMLSPWRERKRGDVDFYTLQIVMATYVACNFMVNTSLQLASLYFKEVLDQPAWVVTVVLITAYITKAFSGRLTPVLFGSYGPESLLQALAMLAIFYGIYSLAPWPVVNMIALICSEFCNDVGIRATQRLLAVCSAKASKKLETYVVINRVAAILACVVGSFLMPNVYFYAGKTTPFLISGALAALLCAHVGKLFLKDVVSIATDGNAAGPTVATFIRGATPLSEASTDDGTTTGSVAPLVLRVSAQTSLDPSGRRARLEAGRLPSTRTAFLTAT